MCVWSLYVISCDLICWFFCERVQVNTAQNPDDSSSRISPYTKSYLEGAADDVTDTNAADGRQQPEPVAEKSRAPAGNETTTPDTSRLESPAASTPRNVTANSPYVPIPAAGSNLPITPYSCIEQAMSDSAVTGEPSSQADADVRPKGTVIQGNDGTKSDGYIPLQST